MKTLILLLAGFVGGFVASRMMIRHPYHRLAVSFLEDGTLFRAAVVDIRGAKAELVEQVFYSPTGTMSDLAPGVPEPPMKEWSNLQHHRFGVKREDKIVSLREIEKGRPYIIQNGMLVVVEPTLPERR